MGVEREVLVGRDARVGDLLAHEPPVGALREHPPQPLLERPAEMADGDVHLRVVAEVDEESRM